MSVREIFGCFADNCPDKKAELPHRDFELKPFGIGYVHEACRLPDDGLDTQPLCELSHIGHYPNGSYLYGKHDLKKLRETQ